MFSNKMTRGRFRRTRDPIWHTMRMVGVAVGNLALAQEQFGGLRQREIIG
jgi:hypothetical protein